MIITQVRYLRYSVLYFVRYNIPIHALRRVHDNLPYFTIFYHILTLHFGIMCSGRVNPVLSALKLMVVLPAESVSREDSSFQRGVPPVHNTHAKPLYRPH